MPNLKPKRHEIHRIFTADIWLQPICAELEKGLSLYEACGVYDDGPSPDTVLKWVKEDPDGSGARYSRAREIGYLVLADRIAEIASQTHAYTMVPLLDAEGNQMSDPEGNLRMKRVLVPLNSDVIAHKRLQIDTLKWKLSKMLPKIYGDKVVQEHTGPGGGPIPIAAVNLRNLKDDELEQMQQLMSKAARIEGNG
jgi:hypothetical protein